MAVHLLKWVQYQRDALGLELELHHFRDQEQREVDFIITERRKPVVAIEVKLSDREATRSLRYFKNKFPQVEAIQPTFRTKNCAKFCFVAGSETF